MITKNSLNILWPFNEGHREVSGLYFYGLWKDFIPQNLNYKFLREIWSYDDNEYRMTEFDVEYKVKRISIYIKSFPVVQWQDSVKATLAWFIEKDAIISWCGNELCDPYPDLQEPSSVLGQVYASYSSELGFFCNSNLDEEYRMLDSAQLIKIYHFLQKIDLKPDFFKGNIKT